MIFQRFEVRLMYFLNINRFIKYNFLPTMTSLIRNLIDIRIILWGDKKAYYTYKKM